MWTTHIEQIEAWWHSNPTITVLKLSEVETVANASLFVESHLQIVKANNGVKIFKPYMRRLWNFNQLNSPSEETKNPTSRSLTMAKLSTLSTAEILPQK